MNTQHDDDTKKAEVDIQHAARNMKEAKRDLEKAEHDLERAGLELEKAEHELEEARIHHRHHIHFEVDGESEETELRCLTPNVIISEFGKKDPSSHYLVRIENGKKIESYQGKGEVEIELHDGMCFQIMSTGPTTVSDGRNAIGVDRFVQELRELGYQPSTLTDKPNHVLFEYRVPTGRLVGTVVRLGFIVPSDFPLSMPTGPHVSPHIHPINTGQGTHPTFGVHSVQAEPFRAAGGDWQYWSRPSPDPATNNKPVAAYMRHIWRLWDSQ